MTDVGDDRIMLMSKMTDNIRNQKRMSQSSNMIDARPILMKMTAMCEREANRNGGIMGGVEVTFKLLVRDEETYAAITSGCSPLLLDVVQKEFDYCHCVFNVVTRSRDIFLSHNYLDNEDVDDVYSQVFSDMAKKKYGHPHEDILVVIKDYDQGARSVDYAVAYHDRIETKSTTLEEPTAIFPYDKVVKC